MYNKSQTNNTDHGTHYRKLKKKLLEKDYSLQSKEKVDVKKELELLKSEDYKLWYEVK